jgi:hypothetical protein
MRCEIFVSIVACATNDLLLCARLIHFGDFIDAPLVPLSGKLRVIDSVSRAFQIFLGIFLSANTGAISAQRNARLGGRICHKPITAILAESVGEFQLGLGLSTPPMLRFPKYRNVWSAAELQAKNEEWHLVCADVFGLQWSQ